MVEKVSLGALDIHGPRKCPVEGIKHRVQCHHDHSGCDEPEIKKYARGNGRKKGSDSQGVRGDTELHGHADKRVEPLFHMGSEMVKGHARGSRYSDQSFLPYEDDISPRINNSICSTQDLTGASVVSTSRI